MFCVFHGDRTVCQHVAKGRSFVLASDGPKQSKVDPNPEQHKQRKERFPPIGNATISDDAFNTLFSGSSNQRREC